MARKRARTITLLKLSPLYLLTAVILYVLFVMDKEVNYLDEGRACFAERNFTEALDQLDIAIDKKKYRGRQLLDALMLRARTLNIMKGYTRALQDLEKIIQLSPKSEEAYQARALMGDILLSEQDFQRAIDTYEFLAVEIEHEDEVRCYEYRSKAAAAAYQYSNVLMGDVSTIIQRNTKDPDPIKDGLIRYVLDFHTDYDLPYVEALLGDELSEELEKEAIDITMEARRYHHYAFDIFKEYPLKSFFNPLASLFLTNIYYRTHKYFPALFESAMAMKEAIPPQQQNELLETRAKIYEEIHAYAHAADAYKTLRLANTKPRKGLNLLRKNYLCLLKSGNYDKVIAEIPPLLKRTKGDFVLQYCQAVANLEKNKPPRAIATLSRMIDAVHNGQAPMNFLNTEERRDSFLQLYKAYMDLNNYGKAMETLGKAIQIYPEDLEFREKRTHLFYEQLNNPGAGVHDYYYLMMHGPRNPVHFERWYDGMDLAYQAANNKSLEQKAKQEVSKFAQLEAMIGSNAKRYPELMDAATFPATVRDIPLRVALSIELLNQGRREQSKGILRMLVRSNPEILEFSYMLGMLYYQEGNAESALAEFQKVLERDPPDIESVKKSFDCYEQLRDYTGKGKLVKKLLEKDFPYLKSWILTRLSFDQGKLDNCMRMYRKLEDTPRTVQNDLDLMAAWCLVDEREFARAEDLIDPILIENSMHINALKAKAKLLLAHPGPIIREPVEEESKPDDTETGTESSGPAEEDDVTESLKPSGDGDVTESLKPSVDGDTTKSLKPSGNGDVAESSEPTGEGSPDSEPEVAAAEAEADSLPPELQKINTLILALRYQHNELTRRDLEDLAVLFVEMNRPELVPYLLEGLDFQFPFSSKLYQAVARAYQEIGRFEKAVDVLLEHASSEADLRWAFGLCAYSSDAINQSRGIMKKYVDTFTHAEPFLRAAICTSLNSGISEASQHLSDSDSFPHWGTYSEHNAEYIDYLVRTLNRFAKLGMDLSIEEVPEEPLEVAEEDVSGDADTSNESDASSESGAALKESDTPGTVPPVADADEGRTTVGDSDDVDRVTAATSDPGAESKKGKRPPSRDGKKRGPRRGTGRFDPDGRRAPPEKTKPDPEEEDDGSENDEPPALTANQIMINGTPLGSKYKKIVAEAVHQANIWRTPAGPEDIVLVKSLLRHLLLRDVPFMEEECIKEAEKVVSLDPLCGLAWRYLLDHKAGDSSPERTLMVLTPVNNAIPGDFESLLRLTIAFGKMQIDTLLLPCLQTLQGMCTDLNEARLIEAEILLATGNREGALDVCQSILAAEGKLDTAVLKRLLPILAGIGAIQDLNDVVTSLVDTRALEESSVDLILSQLEYTRLNTSDQAFLEKLFILATDRQKAQVIALLANSYAKTREVIRLEALAYELARLPNAARQNDEIIYRAFLNTGSALRVLGLNQEAMDLIENLYYLRPDKADTLTLLSTIASEMGKLRKSTEFLNLNQLLRPWDNKNNIILAHNWFFETGEFKKAFNLVRRSRGLSAKDPEEAARILMGYSFLMGDAPQAINYAVHFFSDPKSQTPEIMFLSSSLYYFFEHYAEARKLFTRLNLMFVENPYAERTRYLLDRITPLIQSKKKPKKKRKRNTKT